MSLRLQNEAGSLATFLEPTRAYNTYGSGYMVEEGTTVLVLDLSEYDLTFLSHGEVLFCSAQADFYVKEGWHEPRSTESDS